MVLQRFGVTSVGTNVDGNIPVWDGTNSSDLESGLGVVTSINVSPSDSNVPTEKAVGDLVKYWMPPVTNFAALPVTTVVGETRRVLNVNKVYSRTGAIWLQEGVSGSFITHLSPDWNATTNSPAIISSVGILGDWYIVGIAGNTNINTINSRGVGDYIWFDGSSWQKVNNQVSSGGSVVASQAEANAGLIDNKYISPLKLATYFMTTNATVISNITNEANRAGQVYTGSTTGFVAGQVYNNAGFQYFFNGISVTRASTVVTDLNNKGYFNTLTDLTTTIPVGQIGWYAVVLSTGTYWIRNTGAWIDTGQKISPKSYTTLSDPIAASITTAMVDDYSGVVITLTTTGVAQTIANPTSVSPGTDFIVINNNTSTDNIVVDGETILPGESVQFIRDGTAWVKSEHPLTQTITVPGSQTNATSEYAVASYVKYRQPAVANFLALPVGVTIGEIRETLDNHILNYWSGVAWFPMGSTVSGSLTVNKGSWDATANTPTITSGVGTAGWFYIVGTAGTTTIDGISMRGVGDYIWFEGTTSTWQKIDNSTASLSGYFYKPGQVGGQIANGGINASDKLVLNSTSNATKGGVEIGSNTTGDNLSVLSTIGTNIAPAIVAGQWTLGDSWTIVGGVATHTPPGSVGGESILTQTGGSAIVGLKLYKVTITVSAISTPSITGKLGGSPFGMQYITIPGTYVYYVKTINSNKLQIGVQPTTLLSISSIIIQLVDELTSGRIKAESGINTHIIRPLSNGGMVGIADGVDDINPYVQFGIAGVSFKSSYNIFSNGYLTIGTTSIVSGLNVGSLMQNSIGMIGVSTYPTRNIGIIGTANKTIGMERHTTSDTAGNSLTIDAGGSTLGATDKLGGQLILQPGVSTGSASGIGISIKTYDPIVSGTNDQGASTKMTVSSTGIVAINNLIGGTDRVVQADSTGGLYAFAEIIVGKITDLGVISKLTTLSNRDINGLYVGTAFTYTYEGQYYSDDTYWYMAYSDNFWKRIALV